MSTKYFCDACSREFTAANKPIRAIDGCLAGRMSGKYKNLWFEVTVGKDNQWNGCDFCKYCIIDAINSLDDRPRPKDAP